MNKEALHAKWNEHWNANKIAEDVMDVLTEAGHQNSVHGVCTLLDNSFTNKANLLEIMMRSAHYAGDGRIVIPAEFEREIDMAEVHNFFNDIEKKLCLEYMLTYQDDKGKTLFEQLLTGKKSINVSELAQIEHKNLTDTFDFVTGATKETAQKYNTVRSYMYSFMNMPYVTLTRNIQCDNGPVLKAKTKTSRAFNELCCLYGVDKLNPQEVTKEENGQTVTKTVYPYNKVFAQYSDFVSNLTRKMYYVISVNPLDYLMMSNGISWHSCHRITDGGYKGGTLSYMLDETSIITYVVSNLDEPLHKLPRYYRQMIHYSDGLFMQNRLYPQGNDGATDLYAKFRNLVIAEFSDLLDTANDWEVEQGANTCENHARSIGSHYVDYSRNNSCNIFYPASKRDMIRNHVMTIGHSGICVKCGRSYSNSYFLVHARGHSACFVEE